MKSKGCDEMAKEHCAKMGGGKTCDDKAKEAAEYYGMGRAVGSKPMATPKKGK